MNVDRERWRTEHQRDLERGLKCELHGLKAEDMNRDELLAFVGFLDELATERYIPAKAN